MAEVGNFEMAGKSGMIYLFRAYELNDTFGQDAAIYIVALRTEFTPGKPGYAPLYLGETKDMQTWQQSHNKSDCIKKNGANCIGVCLVPDDQQRASVYNDLLSIGNCICNR